MSSINEHSKVVLSAILPDRRDLLDIALLQLTPEHFQDVQFRAIFKMLEKYYQVTHGILPKSAMSDILKNSGVKDIGILLDYEEKFDLLLETESGEDNFKWSVLQLRELAAKKATVAALTASMTITNDVLQVDKNTELRGHSDARKYLVEQLAEIEQSLQIDETPSGDIRKEKQSILDEYFSKKDLRLQGNSPGIYFGVQSIDEVMGGVQPGDLALIAAYSSAGKSSLCAQLAWRASVLQGKNVVYATGETGRDATRRRLICRHSKLSKFGIADGLNNKWLKEGDIPTPELEQKFLEIVDDFNDSSDYGVCELLQLPRGSTIATLENRITRYQQEFNVDLVICDSLNLLAPVRKRNSRTEETTETVKEAQNIVKTFNNGTGVAVVSPWQINREGKKQSNQSQTYSTEYLAETHEATASSDLILALLEDPNQQGRYARIGAALIKNRDGAKSPMSEISVDYGTSFFSDNYNAPTVVRSSSGSMDDLLGLL